MTCAAKCREIFSSFLLNIITGFKFVKLKHCDRLMFWAVATQQWDFRVCDRLLLISADRDWCSGWRCRQAARERTCEISVRCLFCKLSCLNTSRIWKDSPSSCLFKDPAWLHLHSRFTSLALWTISEIQSPFCKTPGRRISQRFNCRITKRWVHVLILVQKTLAPLRSLSFAPDL